MNERVKRDRPRMVAVKSRYLRRRRILKGERDTERGAKDTEARGTPNEVPSRKR
jgi:hypothetical protein